jgi:branched-chain amino acid transport system permease protein
LRPLHDLRLMVDGLVVVLAVIFLPRGLVAMRLRRTG